MQDPAKSPNLKRLTTLFLAAGLTALTACDDSDDNNSTAPDTEEKVVVSTAAADFSSGAHAVIGTESPYDALTELNPDVSNLAVRARGADFFRFNRDTHTVAKYDIENPETPVWEHSLDDGANPHDLVFLSDSKAYLLQYQKDNGLIVDPSAAEAGQFVTNTTALDLSAYANDTSSDADGYDAVPQMQSGVVVGDRAYLVMQRLIDDPEGGFSKIQETAYVAVFDTRTNTEIDTNPNTDGLKGIKLAVRNPGHIVHDEANNQLVIGAAGDYEPASSDENSTSGGVETINLADTDCSDGSCYSTNQILDDSQGIGEVMGIAVADADTAYAIGYKGWGDSGLYAFNPQDGTLETENGSPKAIANLSGTNLGDIAMSPSGKLWVGVGDSNDPGLTVIDPNDHSVVVERISTTLNPGSIAFTVREQ